ncbi:hypothetical protein TIFTF001_030851 [Ficus carica]|uniref:Uncharacterized protein n=1 Tax=Ficus carica TaxID=3494 RepID=A0AA88DUC7_FICCA|nr:hypothetical protein TIFTF001_030851 [Ficus carica]
MVGSWLFRCLGSCSGTSNSGRCPVVGPNSVVREPQELSAKADVLGPVRARPILVGARSWDLTPWSGNHRSCLQRQKYQSARDFCTGGFDFVHREDGRHNDRGRGLSTQFVDRLHVALPRTLLVSPEYTDSTRGGELHRQVVGGYYRLYRVEGRPPQDDIVDGRPVNNDELHYLGHPSRAIPDLSEKLWLFSGC